MKRLRAAKGAVEEEPGRPSMEIADEMDKIDELEEDLSFEFSAKGSKMGGLPALAAKVAEGENTEEEKE